MQILMNGIRNGAITMDNKELEKEIEEKINSTNIVVKETSTAERIKTVTEDRSNAYLQTIIEMHKNYAKLSPVVIPYMSKCPYDKDSNLSPEAYYNRGNGWTC